MTVRKCGMWETDFVITGKSWKQLRMISSGTRQKRCYEKKNI